LRWVRHVLLVVLLSLAGCGGVGSDPLGVASDPLERSLNFFPENAPLLAVVDTDADGDQQRAFRRITHRFPLSSQLVPQLQDPELKPVLGNPAVIGAQDPRALSDRRQLVIAIEPRDPRRLAELRKRWVQTGRFRRAGDESGFRVLSDSGGELNAFDGKTLVMSGSRPRLSNALRRGREEDGVGLGEFRESFERVPGHALLGLRIDAEALLAASPLGARAQSAPFLSEAKTLGVKLFARDGSLEARFRMTTQRPVDPRDLPLAEGPASPPAVVREGELGVGVRDPAQLLRFLRGGGLGIGSGKVEERIGIQFTRDFVKQVRGDAALSFVPGRGWALRAQVRDPKAMKRTLDRITRRAADAARTYQNDVISITPPRDAGGVYLLDRIGDDLAFGLFGDRLVFADSKKLAIAIAKAPTRRVPGAKGALVVSARPEELRNRFVRQFAPAGALGDLVEPSIFLRPLDRLDASVEASEDGLSGRLVQRFD
jgi:hypothetical protein